MSIMDVVKSFKVSLHDCLLKQTTEDINSFTLKEVVDALEYAYNSNDANERRIATLLNSIFTHQAQTFLLTKKSYCDLIEQDKNSTYTSLNGTEYKTLISIMISGKIVVCLRPFTGRKSAVYKVINKDIVDTLHKIHSRDWFELQESKVCNYYDGLVKSTSEDFEVEVLSVKDQVKQSLRNKGYKI